MPKIHLQSTEIEYAESDVITFEEGIIGLPHLRRLVVINQPEIVPFLWLASVEEPEIAFLVMEPLSKFEDYAPSIPVQTRARIGLADGEEPLLLTIVRVTPEWQLTTINLRAPLVIAPSTMHGIQLVLTESDYSVDQPLAMQSAAA